MVGPRRDSSRYIEKRTPPVPVRVANSTAIATSNPKERKYTFCRGGVISVTLAPKATAAGLA